MSVKLRFTINTLFFFRKKFYEVYLYNFCADSFAVSSPEFRSPERKNLLPRMGRRTDVVLIIRNIIFVLEFKAGEKDFNQSTFDQVWDYAPDLKNFHELKYKNPFILYHPQCNFLCESPLTKNNKRITYEATQIFIEYLIISEVKLQMSRFLLLLTQHY
jgi:hypothetical protein